MTWPLILERWFEIQFNIPEKHCFYLISFQGLTFVRHGILSVWVVFTASSAKSGFTQVTRHLLYKSCDSCFEEIIWSSYLLILMFFFVYFVNFTRCYFNFKWEILFLKKNSSWWFIQKIGLMCIGLLIILCVMFIDQNDIVIKTRESW